MRTPLQPIWDAALKHWDEVLPSLADYSACISTVSKVFDDFVNVLENDDIWTDEEVLIAAFTNCGYKDMIPGILIGAYHERISRFLIERVSFKENFPYDWERGKRPWRETN